MLNRKVLYFDIDGVFVDEKYLGTRILDVKTEGDGSDIVGWMDQLV